MFKLVVDNILVTIDVTSMQVLLLQLLEDHEAANDNAEDQGGSHASHPDVLLMITHVYIEASDVYRHRSRWICWPTVR